MPTNIDANDVRGKLAGSGPSGHSVVPVDLTRFAAHELLTQRQIGELFGCSPRSVRHWLHQHRIRAADAPGRTKRYRAGDVQVAVRGAQAESAAA